VYSLTIDLGQGANLTVQEETVEALLEGYEHMKGDGRWLTSRIMDVVQAIEAGTHDAGVNVIHVHVPEAAPRDDSRQDSAGGQPEDRWAQDGPWSKGGSGSRQEGRGDEPKTYPWDGTPVEDKGSQRRSGPSRGTSGDDTHGVTTQTDKFDRRWTMGLPEAPLCYCGDPAARVQGRGQQSGKPYTQYRCAKGAPNGDYRNKCEFSEFPK